MSFRPPPVYRPNNALPGQPKTTPLGSTSRPNPAPLHTIPPPPAYRPQPRATQLKAAAPPVCRPANVVSGAPPLYRPNTGQPLQRNVDKTTQGTRVPLRDPTTSPSAHRFGSTPMPALRQPMEGLPLRTGPGFAAGKAQAPQPQWLGPSPFVVTPQLTPRPCSRVAQGVVGQTPANPNLLPGTVQPPVVQRMEDLKKGFVSFGLGALTKVANLIYRLPNPFEMTHFTSCVCLVFNSAGRANQDYKTDISRNVVFDSIKSNWETHHPKGSFHDVCPFDENDSLTPEWAALMNADIQGNGSVFGDRPLIVIVGHSNPGSDSIRSDDQKKYSIKDVYTAIRPALRNRCTIYLSPCNTGISTSSEASFQERFTQELNTELSTELKNDFEVLTIGTLSTSFPAKGQVLTTGQTYSHVKSKSGITKSGLIGQEKYLKKESKS